MSCSLPTACRAGWPFLTGSRGSWQGPWGLGPLHLAQAGLAVLNARGLGSIYTEKITHAFHCLGFAFFCSAAFYLSCQDKEGLALLRGTSALCKSRQAHLPPQLPSAAAPQCPMPPERQEMVSQNGWFPSTMEKQQLLENKTRQLLVCTKTAAWGKLSRNHQGLAVVSKVTLIFCDPGEAQPSQACGQNTDSGSEVESETHAKCHVLHQLLC